MKSINYLTRRMWKIIALIFLTLASLIYGYWVLIQIGEMGDPPYKDNDNLELGLILSSSALVIGAIFISIFSRFFKPVLILLGTLFLIFFSLYIRSEGY